MKTDIIYNADSILAIPDLVEDNSVDLIIADPPFAIDFKKKKQNYNRKVEYVLDGYAEIPKKDYPDFTMNWIKEAHRVLKNNGSIYIFSGWNNLEDILRALRLNNFYTINQLIWKYNFGVYTKRKFVNSHYNILYVSKKANGYKFNREAFYCDGDESNGLKLNYLHRQSVWNISREYWRGIYKPQTKLPREIVEKMMFYSSDIGDIILDPFMGSGQVPFIASEYGRRFVGFELGKEIFEFAKYRIENNDYYGKGFNLKEG